MKLRVENQPSRNPSGLARGIPLLPGLVNSENFVEKAIAFMRASGRTNGEHPVVRRDDPNPLAWQAWLAFFRIIGVPSKAAEQRGTLTVPSEFPWEFSVDADSLRDMQVAPRQAGKFIDPHRRRYLSDMLRNSQPRSTYKAKRPEPLRGAMPGDPVPSLSSELRARMGLADDLPEERT